MNADSRSFGAFIFSKKKIMFAFGGLVLYWVEYPIPMILILRPNVNIFGWMYGYWEFRHDIEVEYQMLFGWSKGDISVL
jgi:hypothetical protein